MDFRRHPVWQKPKEWCCFFCKIRSWRTDSRNNLRDSINPNSTKIKKAKFSLPEAVVLLDAWDIIIE